MKYSNLGQLMRAIVWKLINCGPQYDTLKITDTFAFLKLVSYLMAFCLD